MNYSKTHNQIIERAKLENRNKQYGVYELHHIHMKSLGGDDSEENTVLLTPKEHFIIHALLWKMNPNNRKYRDPIFMFKHKGGKNSRVYDAARREHIVEMKTNNPSTYLTEESKKSKSEKLKKRVFSEEHRRKISESKKGQSTRAGAKLSKDSKRKISDGLKQYFQENEVSEETRRKLSEANKGFKHSDETLVLLTERAKNRKKWSCPHCNKLFDGGNLKRHMLRNGFSLEDIQKCRDES